ncbi:MAG: hypothetical protein Q9227_003242 [Pyrenula ochraceoflavens]
MAPSAITTEELHITTNHKENKKILPYQHGGSKHGERGVKESKELVLDIMKTQVARIDVDSCSAGEEDAFYVADLGKIYRQHLRWKLNLPRVKPFYAVKCNPNFEVLRLLSKLGTGFDCASHAEIERVLQIGVEPDRIIYAQPCKTKSYVRYAASKGVKQMTFDNADELYKIKKLYPDAELFLRILTDDSASLCRLSTKFGACLEKTQELIDLASELELNLVGVSFHVGSGAGDPTAFVKAVRDAAYVFDQASIAGYDLQILDVGGGFEDATFETFASALTEALDMYIPAHVRVIGEPGRYYVGSAFTLATNVIARRDVPKDFPLEQAYMLYLNDGVYGNFSNIIFDHQHPTAQVLATTSNSPKPVEYSIWGPTCDGIDMISASCILPGVVNVGDWLYFENMGAYTVCSATKFNGFTDNHEVIYISSEPGASALLDY